MDWSVDPAGPAVVAVVRAALIGPDPATGIAVRVRSGAVSGDGALDADGSATLPLVDAQRRPMPESAAWDHDWPATSVIVGAPISEPRNRARYATGSGAGRGRGWTGRRGRRLPGRDPGCPRSTPTVPVADPSRGPALPYAERVPNTYRVVQWNTGNVGKSSLTVDRHQPPVRTGRVLRVVAGQGRARRRRTVRHRTGRGGRDQ